jgi:ABC-2 type transport system permease protein
MIAQILNLVRKELLQFRRDRLLTPFILLGPVFQLVLLANATSTDVSNLRVGFLDQDRTALSRELITAFANSSQLSLWGAVSSPDEGRHRIESEQVDLILIIPPDFAADVTALRRPQVQVIIDGSNGVVGAALTRTAQGILSQFQVHQLRQMGLATGLDDVGIDLRAVVYYNPELNYRFSALPAQLGFIVYIVTMLVASLGISRERERGTMEQLSVTPLRRSELMIGKAIPTLVIALADFAIMLTLVTQLFGVPLRGSALLLLATTALYVLVEMNVGLVISSLATSQQQSLLMVFLLGVLNVAFSGYLVPVKNMPWLLNKMSYLFPVQHYVNIVKQIMLKGADAVDIAADIAALLVLGTVIVGAAYNVVQRRLD